jgi:hypothetical protein
MARSDAADDAGTAPIVSPARPKISAAVRASAGTASKNGHGSKGHSGSNSHGSNGHSNGNGHRVVPANEGTIKNHRGQPDLSFEDMS